MAAISLPFYKSVYSPHVIKMCLYAYIYVYLQRFGMWCWKRMLKISWTDRVRNEEVLQRVKEERNILKIIKRRKAN
jgi:hypothetical protein